MRMWCYGAGGAYDPGIAKRNRQTAKLVLEPIFEADLDPSAYGYRPRRGGLDAIRTQAKLVGPHVDGGGAVGEQILLAFLDAVLHLAAGAIDLLVEASRVNLHRRE
jgi:hypothetical protein